MLPVSPAAASALSRALPRSRRSLALSSRDSALSKVRAEPHDNFFAKHCFVLFQVLSCGSQDGWLPRVRMSYLRPPRLQPDLLEVQAGLAWSRAVIKVRWQVGTGPRGGLQVLQLHQHSFGDSVCLRVLRHKLGEHVAKIVPHCLRSGNSIIPAGPDPAGSISTLPPRLLLPDRSFSSRGAWSSGERWSGQL